MESSFKFLDPKSIREDEFLGYVIGLKDIRKGDVFYECEKYKNYELVALENPKRIGETWKCQVLRTTTGETMEMVSTEIEGDLNVFAPNIFRYPVFLSQNEKGKNYYIIE